MSDLRYAIKRRRLRRGRSGFAAALMVILGALVIWQAVSFYRHFMPIAVRLAQAEANYIVSAVINNAIAARLAEGELEYSDIISLEKDENGTVAAIMTNSAKVNKIKTAITADVINALDNRKSYRNKASFRQRTGYSCRACGSAADKY